LSLFISFEGGEGTGKTTQAEILAEGLRDIGISVLFIHEPGSTELGWYIRDWLKRGLRTEQTISHSAELFLFAAARAELVTKIIQPALEQQNTIIIADRFVDSTTAYQGYGRRIPLGYIKAVNDLATQGIKPNLTFLLDCMPQEGLAREGTFQMRLPLELPGVTAPIERNREGVRFGEESLEFHERVRQGYLIIAQEEPDRWRVIDAQQSIEEIGDIIWKYVEEKLPVHDHPAITPLLLYESSIDMRHDA